MTKRCLIVYEAGCYGTLVEWLLNYLQDSSLEIPFNNNGNSHKFLGNFLEPKLRILEYIESNKSGFSRVHPGSLIKNNTHQLDTVFDDELLFYKSNFEKVLVLNYSLDSVLWYENNALDKIFVSDAEYERFLKPYGVPKQQIEPLTTKDPVLRIKHYIDVDIKNPNSTLTEQNLLGWNKHSIYDFTVWEVRELMSFYWFSRSRGIIDSWNNTQLKHKDILFLSIDAFKQDFLKTVNIIVSHFGLENIDQESLQLLPTIHQQWLELQTHMHKDELCKKIVDSLVNNYFFDWAHVDLSIVDEAWIQKSLRDHGVLIKCDNLERFPTNTNNFIHLLEFAQ